MNLKTFKFYQFAKDNMPWGALKKLVTYRYPALVDERLNINKTILIFRRFQKRVYQKRKRQIQIR